MSKTDAPRGPSSGAVRAERIDLGFTSVVAVSLFVHFGFVSAVHADFLDPKVDDDHDAAALVLDAGSRPSVPVEERIAIDDPPNFAPAAPAAPAGGAPVPGDAPSSPAAAPHGGSAPAPSLDALDGALSTLGLQTIGAMQKGGPPKPHETATASDGSLDEVARELGGVDADGPKMKGASASGGPIAGGPIKVDPGVTKGKPTTAPTAPVGEPPVKANEPFVAPATGNGPKDVDAIIAKNRWRFRACYNKELQLHPDAMGTLKVKVDVAEDGTVTGAHVMSSDVSPTLEACVLGAFRAMRFAEEEHACLFVVPVRLTTGK